MEGYLKKWVNIMSRWQNRYVILHEDILVYCEEKGGPKKGAIHLKIASLILVPDDQLRIIIHSGTAEIHFRAETISEKIEWLNALRNAQEYSYSKSGNEDCDIAIKEIKDNNLRESLKNLSNNKVNEILTDIWCTQAQFDEIMSFILSKIEKLDNNQLLKDQACNLERIGGMLKQKVTQCCRLLEDEKLKIIHIAQSLENDPLKSYNCVSRYFQDDDNATVFQSFHDDNFSLKSQQQSQPSQQPWELQSIKQLSIGKQSVSLATLLEHIKNRQPLKYKMVSVSPLSKVQELPTQEFRTFLPVPVDPKNKIRLLGLLKDLIGKDLSRFSMPVQMNEPLSMLQRLTEQLQYYKLIEEANKQENSTVRMMYIMAIGMAPYANTLGRTGKPFNPILGETFELITQDFKFISEQVSHHPPISAGYAFNNIFEYYGNTNVKSTFWGKSMEVTPVGQSHIILKQHKDHFTFTKCNTLIKNILVGQMYIDQEGTMKFQNHNTNDYGELNFTEQGWTGKGAYEMKGFVKNSKGIITYNLYGKWNEKLVSVDVNTKEEKLIWVKDGQPVDAEKMYNFNTFVVQLNHMSVNTFLKVPLTDCRLRPDQRAMELGLIDMANDEKHRLEEKQRGRRREMQEKNQKHVARWFVEEKDILGETIYKYKGGYFEQREKGFDNILDLF